MSGRRIQLIALLATLCIALAGWGCAGPVGVGPSPSAPSGPVTTPGPAASAPAAGVPFTSARYGYRLIYPAGWTMSETPGAGGVHPDEPGVDTLTDRAGHIVSVVGEANVPALGTWTCAISQHLQGEHRLAVEQLDEVTVAGLPATVRNYHLVITPYVIHYLTVEIVHAGQGLTVSLESTTGRDDEDRAILRSLLDQLAFSG